MMSGTDKIKRRKKINQALVVGGKGFLLGGSVVIPGLSGGTMAFILGIYEKLIEEIANISVGSVKGLFVRGLSRLKAGQSLFSEKAGFFLPLITGFVLSVILFVLFAPSFIEKNSFIFSSLVFGLILASVFKPFREIKITSVTLALLVLSFAGHALLFVLEERFSAPLFLKTDLIFLPAGFLASVALLVPGLSGSYLLFIMGLYERTLRAFHEGDLFVMACFFLGALLGFFAVARLMQKLIKSYFNETMAVILGLLLSSLYAVYPLPKESLEDILSFDISRQKFLFYSALSFFIFMGMEWLAKKSPP